MATDAGTISLSRSVRILAGAVLVNMVAGALYAWSLFIEPAQAALEVGRTAVSSIFAVSTTGFAVAVMATPLLVRPGTALRPALSTTGLSVLGLLLAGRGESLWTVMLGYGVLYGVASGIGYSTALQSAVGALPARRGLATGIAVCAHAMGAAVFAPFFRAGLEAWNIWETFLATALAFAGLGLVGAALLLPATIPRADRHADERLDGPFWRLWFGFFCGASAGLMALGHAAAIVNAYDLVAPAAALGTGLITAANGAGRLYAGAVSDYWHPRSVLLGAKVLAAGALVSLVIFESAPLVYVVLTITGFAYGSMASGYPTATLYYYGPTRLGRVYGKMLTAWGAAGLSAPLVAGALYDRTGSYTLALLLAAGAAAVALAIIWSVPRRHSW